VTDPVTKNDRLQILVKRNAEQTRQSECHYSADARKARLERVALVDAELKVVTEHAANSPRRSIKRKTDRAIASGEQAAETEDGKLTRSPAGSAAVNAP
jgi:hypothetical protein